MENTKTISASVSKEFHELAVKHAISWSEAMRIGLAIMLAERGVTEFRTELNVHRVAQILEIIK